MEPNLAQQEAPQIPQMDLGQMDQIPLADSGMMRSVSPPQRGIFKACLPLIILLAIIIVFIFFGGAIFGFFHIENVYHFIISLFIFLILYILTLFVSGMFIKYPKDILSIVIDRLRS